jgi:hypothetical protein
MLKLYSADHPRNLVDRTETCRPVRHGETSVVAGDQAACQQQQESQSGNKKCETMMGSVVTGETQNLLLDSDSATLALAGCSSYGTANLPFYHPASATFVRGQRS